MRESLDEFTIEFMNIIRYRPLTSSSIHFLLVLKGTVTVREQGMEPCSLLPLQVYVINKNVSWQLDSETENITLVVSVTPIWLFHRADNFCSCTFSLENGADLHFNEQLAQCLLHIAIIGLKKNSATWRLQIHKLLLEIFCILIEHFQLKTPAYPTQKYSPRVTKVIAWIEAHYMENITLKQLAKHHHITGTHLSRLFSQETGINFRTWLMNVRFTHAVREIALTTRPIGQIISANGLSSHKRFSCLFRQRYGTLPGKYRRGVKAGQICYEKERVLSPQGTQEGGSVRAIELYSLLSQAIKERAQTTSCKPDIKVKKIHLRLNGSLQPVRKQRYVVATGPWEELLKYHVQQQLVCLKARLHELQIETADPLIGTAASCLADGEAMPVWSPWSNRDLAIGFLKQAGIAPMIMLSPLCTSLSFADYLRGLEDFIEHNVLLQGKVYLESWSFILDIKQLAACEAINPDDCGHRLVSILDTLLPKCRVGLTWDEASFTQLRLGAALLRRVDFVSFAFSPNDSDDAIVSAQALPEGSGPDLRERLGAVTRQLRRRGVDKPLYLRSWSTLTGSTLRTNGLFFRGALLMETLLALPNDITMLGIWLNSEVQHEVSVGDRIENNSLSLFFSSTTKRPVFHIIMLKERLAGDIFSSGDGWIATRNQGGINVLLFNTVAINPVLSVQQHLLEDYGKCFNVRLDLEDAGIWRIKKWVFDQKNGALYHQYGMHPTRYDRDEETMHYISQRSEPTLTVSDEYLESSWTMEIIMDLNAVCLLEFRRVSG